MGEKKYRGKMLISGVKAVRLENIRRLIRNSVCSDKIGMRSFQSKATQATGLISVCSRMRW